MKDKNKIMRFLLKWPAKLMLAKHKPTIIYVTGGAGKTSAREAIFTTLKHRYSVWQNAGDCGSEINPLLSIFGITTVNFSWLAWFIIWPKVIGRLIRMSRYPDFLVLESCAEEIGGENYLFDFARPEIAVIAADDKTAVDAEFSAKQKETTRETLRLIKALPSSSLAVLDYDNADIVENVDKIRAKILTFGFNKNADVSAEAVEVHDSDDGRARISFKIAHKGNIVPVRFKNAFDKNNVYAALAAAAVGLHLGMNLVEISESLHDFAPSS